VQVSLSSGYYQSPLTFTGSGFGSGETVDIYLQGVGSAVLVSAQVDSTGAFKAAFLAPESPGGSRLFIALGQSSGRLGAVNFTMNPKLILNPTSGSADSSVSAQGYGFRSLDLVKMYWDNTQDFLGYTKAGVHGTFQDNRAFQFTVPPGASTGLHKVWWREVFGENKGWALFNVN
jgi:hypothetical protein